MTGLGQDGMEHDPRFDGKPASEKDPETCAKSVEMIIAAIKAFGSNRQFKIELHRLKTLRPCPLYVMATVGKHIDAMLTELAEIESGMQSQGKN